MYTYKVTVRPINETEPGAFAGIKCDHEFDEFNDDGNEVYTVTSKYDISRQLDLSDGVISYYMQQ